MKHKRRGGKKKMMKRVQRKHSTPQRAARRKGAPHIFTGGKQL